MRARGLLSALALAAPCTACMTEQYRQRVSWSEQLDWLRQGTTERSEVLERLGPSRHSFENERIQTWDLSVLVRDPGSREDEVRTAPHSLVLVFDETQRVVRASLVRIR